MVMHALSDLHGHYPHLPGGDLLIIAGDCTARDESKEWGEFAIYLDSLDYKDIVLVAGNHDGCLQNLRKHVMLMLPKNVTYIEDEEKTIQGLRIYGSPWTPTFCDWHFMKHPKELAEHWEQIPEGLDILVTHGPPRGVLDRTDSGRHGDQWLSHYVALRRPKCHIFGHIHEGHGTDEDAWTWDGDISTKYYNVAIRDGEYKVRWMHTEIE